MNFLGSSLCWEDYHIIYKKRGSFASFSSINMILLFFPREIALAVLQYNVENNGKTGNFAWDSQATLPEIHRQLCLTQAKIILPKMPQFSKIENTILEERLSVFYQVWCFPRVFHRCLYEDEKFPSILVCSSSLIAQLVKNLPATQETPVLFPGQEDPL